MIVEHCDVAHVPERLTCEHTVVPTGALLVPHMYVVRLMSFVPAVDAVTEVVAACAGAIAPIPAAATATAGMSEAIVERENTVFL